MYSSDPVLYVLKLICCSLDLNLLKSYPTESKESGNSSILSRIRMCIEVSALSLFLRLLSLHPLIKILTYIRRVINFNSTK